MLTGAWEPETYPRLARDHGGVRPLDPARRLRQRPHARDRRDAGAAPRARPRAARSSSRAARSSRASSTLTAVSALHYAGFALIAAGLLDEAIAGYDRAYDEAVRRGDATRLASVLCFRGRFLTMRGDLNRALDDLREGLDLALGHGVLAGLAYLYGFLILAHVERAELDEAQADARAVAASPRRCRRTRT